MTHFVFFETPPEVLERTAPLRAELAALQMRPPNSVWLPKYPAVTLSGIIKMILIIHPRRN